MKETLARYLQVAREAVVWKLEGLSERDMRRPLVPSGTNLLGLVKHLTCVELGYFTTAFDRPADQPNTWFAEGAEETDDCWARPDETSAAIIGAYRSAWVLADATIAALDLESPGRVPWWGDREVTLGWVLVHVLAETNRHAGHADVVRELVDGSVGFRSDDDNMGTGDLAGLHDRIAAAADAAAD